MWLGEALRPAADRPRLLQSEILHTESGPDVGHICSSNSESAMWLGEALRPVADGARRYPNRRFCIPSQGLTSATF
ncbi:MAG: hypothetical protein AAF497_09045, partial [Planctomycetota bacterium]